MPTEWNTPPEVVSAVLDRYPDLPEPVLDAGFGTGALLREVDRAGYRCHGVDIREDNHEAVKRSDPELVTYVGDFLDGWETPDPPSTIICCPPVGLATKFLERALSMLPEGGRVVMLTLRKLEREPVAKVYLNVVHPINGEVRALPGRAAGDGWAWFVWVKGYSGPTIYVPVNVVAPVGSRITQDEALTYDRESLSRTILILACPRSGTTLLHQAIVACWPNRVSTFAGFEVPPLPANIRSLAGASTWNARLLFKMPEWPRGNPYLFRKYLAGGGHILGILRDPRCCLASTIEQKDGKDHDYFIQEDVPVVGLGEASWRIHTTRMLDLSDSLGPRRVTLLAYEKLVTTPLVVSEALEILIGGAPAHALETWHEHAGAAFDGEGSTERALGGVRPLDPSRAVPLLSWAQLSGETRAVARRAGYETRDSAR